MFCLACKFMRHLIIILIKDRSFQNCMIHKYYDDNPTLWWESWRPETHYRKPNCSRHSKRYMGTQTRNKLCSVQGHAEFTRTWKARLSFAQETKSVSSCKLIGLFFLLDVGALLYFSVKVNKTKSLLPGEKAQITFFFQESPGFGQLLKFISFTPSHCL